LVRLGSGADLVLNRIDLEAVGLPTVGRLLEVFAWRLEAVVQDRVPRRDHQLVPKLAEDVGRASLVVGDSLSGALRQALPEVVEAVVGVVTSHRRT
jgi:hypothetical protein